MIDKNSRGSTAHVAKAFGQPDSSWAAILLDRIGVDIAPDGTFDFEKARVALETACRRPLSSKAGPEDVQRLITKEMMGSTSAQVFSWIIRKLLPKHSLSVVGSQGSRITISRGNEGERMWIRTYIAMTDKAAGKKAGFTLSGLDNEQIPWIVLVVQPWGEVFLWHRTEFLGENSRNDDKAHKDEVEKITRKFITISRGRLKNRFEDRVTELLSADKDWERF